MKKYAPPALGLCPPFLEPYAFAGWALSQHAESPFSGAAVASRQAVAGAPVKVGDTVYVWTTFDSVNSPSDVVTDNLGNVYTLVVQVINATATQAVELWKTIVTVAGTPTVTQRFNPTPGTSTGASCQCGLLHFVGSSGASANNGNTPTQAQNAPGPGAGAVTPGVLTTTADRCLCIAIIADVTSNSLPNLTTPAGFATLGINPVGGNGMLIAYGTQLSKGALSFTATAGVGADNFASCACAQTTGLPT